MIGRRRDAHVAEQLARDDWRRLSMRVDELLEERLVFMQMRDREVADGEA